MSEFIPPSQLKEAVSRGDLSLAREVLQAILNTPKRPSNFIRRSLDWAEQKLDGFSEPHNNDETPLVEDKSTWTFDYYIAQKARLRTNFSRQRFIHLIEIRDYLRDEGHSSFQKSVRNAPSSNKSTNTGRSRKPDNNNMLVVVGVVVVICILLAVASRLR